MSPSIKALGKLDASPLGFDAFTLVTLTSSFVSASLSDLEELFYRPILRLSILSPSRLPVPPPRRSRKVMNLVLWSQRVLNIVNTGKS